MDPRFLFPLLFTCLLACSAATSQNLFNYDKGQLKKWYKKHCTKNDYRLTITETDSSLTAFVQFGDSGYLTHLYYFDGNNHVEKLSVVANCDSCFKKYVKRDLDTKNIRWVPVNDTFYISQFSKKMIFEVHPSVYSYSLTRVPWTPNQYQALLPKSRERSLQEWMKEIDSSQPND